MNRARILFVLPLALAAACQPRGDGDDGAGVVTAAIATGSVDLVAVGSLPGNVTDRSCATAGALENGVPGNLLGGLGSGIAYAGWNRFIAVPDRGPNAVAYDPTVDDTTSYINRFQTIRMHLAPAGDGAALPFSLTPTLEETTLLSRGRHYFTGKSDGFDAVQPSSDPRDRRLDPESVRVSNDGLHVFISDEYGPYLYEFGRATGERLRAIAMPAELAVAKPNARGALEISDNSVGRVANKGMEGLAITPDGRTLLGAMQSPLLQDGGTGGRFTRIIRVDLKSGATRQAAYELTNIGSASKPKYPTISDVVAINDHELLVDERDGKGRGDGSAAAYKRLYRVDLDGAADVSGLAGEASLDGKAMPKTLFLDVVAVLGAHGIAPTEVPAKLEGLAFGPDLVVDGKREHTLWLANDNDFVATVVDDLHPAGVDNPNQFFVFAVDDVALPGFEPQRLHALF